MSLPWFAFNIKDFIANTRRLNTEAKGAYLCLMLDYYQQGAGPPDDDEVLATIAELPVDAWKRHRRVIEPLFIVENGQWKHDRIDCELLEANRKHEATTARASAGGRAKALKMRSSHHPAPQTPVNDTKSCSESAPSMLEASLETAQSTITIDSLSTRANEVLKEEVPPTPPPDPEQAISMPISRTFTPSPEIIERIMREADLSTIHLEIQKFVFHHLEQGSFSCDWQASFEKWWTRFVEHHKKTAKPRAAPRIEVNTTTTEIDWDRQITRWLKNNSMWSHKLCGPEPGQAGCRVPLEKLQQFNIDPITGLVIIAAQKVASG